MQMRLTGSPDRAGMTLLEVLGCIVILAVVINLAASVFITSTRLSVLGTSALDKMCAVEDIRSEFVGAVRASSAVCAGVGKYRSGPDQIVLQMAQPGDQKGVKGYVVFGPIGSDSRLDKLVILEKDGKHTAERFVTYPLDLDSIQFKYDSDVPHESRLASLEISARNNGNKQNNPLLHRFTAAMRNVSADGKGT
jgi:hypothetical protein